MNATDTTVTVTVNRADWSGKDGTITIHADGTFAVEGLDGLFRIVDSTKRDPGGDAAWDYMGWSCVSADGAWPADYELAAGGAFRRDIERQVFGGGLDAYTEHGSSMSIGRDGSGTHARDLGRTMTRHLSIGIDPSSTHVGLAALDEDAQLVALDVVRPKHDKRVHHLAPGFFDAVCGYSGTVLVERMPQKTRRSSGPRTSGNSGWHIGWWGGRFAGRLEALDFEIAEPVDAGAWRESMLVWSAQNGLLLERPSRRRSVDIGRQRTSIKNTQLIGGSYHVTFHCGHYAVINGYDALVRTASAPDGCKQCVPKRVLLPEELVADQWKELACKFVCFHWRTAYDELVADARSRAKKVGQPDHHLQGVHDACEAVGVAIHAYVTK